MKYRILIVPAVLLGLAWAPSPTPAKPARGGGDPLAEKVFKAMQGGIKYLRGQQFRDGSWEVDALSSTFPGGWTSLSLLALLNAGVPPKDKMIQRGLEYLRKQEPNWTYVRALQTMVFVEANQNVDSLRIQRNVKWLIENRVRDKDGRLLGWPYTEGKHTTDNSNTQYALLGLHAGRLAGAKIPRAIWKEIQDYYLNTQKDNGGWGYNKSNAELTYLTMNTAGLCGLLISGMELNSSLETFNKDGSVEKCGQYKENKPAQKALRLIGGEQFTVNLKSRIYYNLYGIERVGRLSGLRFLGQHDWYREGCEFLVNEQDSDNGAWPSRPKEFDQWPIINTSFALLFLSKGRTPVLISKMVHGDGENIRYGARADWNHDRNDIKHLVEFASRELFKKQPLAWQVFDAHRGYEGRKEGTAKDQLRGLTSDLLQSPIAYFNGHKGPQFKEIEIDLLKKYVDNGGFIVAEACCGREEFDEGFKKLITDLFDEKTKLVELDANHPVWTAFFKVDPRAFKLPKPFKLYGIKRGCKTVLIYSPQDLSCLWEANKFDSGNGQLAFRLGANIIAYATGLEMPKPRLVAHRVAEDRKLTVPRNAIKVAQLKYSGDWQPAPRAMSNLMDYLDENISLKVDRETEAVSLDDGDIVQFKFLYMHGRTKFSFKDEDLKKLRFNLKKLRFNLQTGGLLFADACCGKEPFDTSFRAFMKELFPKNKLEPIPLQKEYLYSAKLNGEAIDESNIRCRIKRADGMKGEAEYRNMAPALEGIKIDNRWVVIYSKYDIGCALEKHQSVDCLGYDNKSALRLSKAAMLYALKR